MTSVSVQVSILNLNVRLQCSSLVQLENTIYFPTFPSVSLLAIVDSQLGERVKSERRKTTK